jgi:hypothetical protein
MLRLLTKLDPKIANPNLLRKGNTFWVYGQEEAGSRYHDSQVDANTVKHTSRIDPSAVDATSDTSLCLTFQLRILSNTKDDIEHLAPVGPGSELAAFQ